MTQTWFVWTVTLKPKNKLQFWVATVNTIEYLQILNQIFSAPPSKDIKEFFIEVLYCHIAGYIINRVYHWKLCKFLHLFQCGKKQIMVQLLLLFWQYFLATPEVP